MRDILSRAKNPMEYFRVKKPDFMGEFQGRILTAYRTFDDAKQRTNPTEVKVEMIVGNLTHQTMFEVNGEYLVSMLDAYSELNREALPDQKTHEEFLDTVMTDIHAGTNRKARRAAEARRRRSED